MTFLLPLSGVLNLSINRGKRSFLNLPDQLIALLVSPFITSYPLKQLVANVSGAKSVRFKILTGLESTSMFNDSRDVNAILEFCHEHPKTKIGHLPRLNAKVYVEDNHTAIITLGNPTSNSPSRNLEYGIRLTDHDDVLEVS